MPFHLRRPSLLRTLVHLAACLSLGSGALVADPLLDKTFGPISGREYSTYGVIPIYFSGLGIVGSWSDLTNWALLSGPILRPDPLPTIKLFNEININMDGNTMERIVLDTLNSLSVVDNAWVGINFTGSRKVWLLGQPIYQTTYENHPVASDPGRPYEIYLWKGGMKNFTPQDVIIQNINVLVDADQTWVAGSGGFDLDQSVFLLSHTLTIAGQKQVRIGDLDGTGTVTWSQGGGTLQLNSAAHFTGTIDTTAGASPGTVFLKGSNGVFNGRIIGSGRVAVNGVFTLGGTQANSFTGPVEVTGGTLILNQSVQNGAVTGSSLKITQGSSVVLAASHQIANTVPVLLANSSFMVGGFLDTIGSLELTGSSVEGPGRLTLAAGGLLSHASADLSTISAELGSFGNLEANVEGLGPFNLGGLVISGVITGSGVLKRGTGDLTLSGNNFIDRITVEQGRVIMGGNAAFGSTGTEMVVLDGGTLRLDNNFVGTLSSGRVFVIGSNGGTLDTNGTNITLASGLGGTGAFVKLGSSRLTLPGTSTVSSFDLREGIVMLHSIPNSTATLGTFTLTKGRLQVDGSLSFDTSTSWNMAPGQMDAGTGANRNEIYLDGFTVIMPGLVSGSGGLTVVGGTLRLSGNNTYSGLTKLSGATLRISSAAALGSTAAILFDAGTLALDGSAAYNGRMEITATSATLDTNGWSFTSNGDLVGSGPLHKAGAGELRLNGSKSFTGELWVDGGVLALETGLSAGRATRIRLEGGSLRLLNSMTLAVPVDANFSGAAIDTGAGQVTLGTVLSGNVIKQGTGTLSIAADNALSALTVAAGLVEFGPNSLTGTNLTLDGGGLKWAPGNTTDISAQLHVITAAGGTLDLGANNVTFASGNNWSGTLVKAGTGRLTFTTGNGFLGGVVVQAGSLAFNLAQDGGVADVISGAGAVAHLGASTLTLGGANTFTGGLTVSGGGDVLIPDGGTPGAGTVTLTNGHLVFDQGFDSSFAGSISGGGSLIKLGLGTLTLSGASTFTGGVSIISGTLVAAQAGALGTGGNISLDDATLRAGTNVTLTLAASRSVSLSNNSRMEADAGAVFTLNGAVSGSAWTKGGAGTLVLGHANTFTGLLTVSGGTLALAHSGALGSSTGLLLDAGTLRADTTLATVAAYGITLQNGAALEAAAGATLTLGGVLAGGPLVKNGAGAVVLTNSNTFTGGIVLNGGTLSGSLAALPGDVSGMGGTLRVDEGGGSTWKVQISGGVGLEFFNSSTPFGVMNLDAATHFTHGGVTQISGGVLVNLNAANTLSAGSALIVNGQLDLAGGSQTVSSLSGSGLIYSFNLSPVTAILANGASNASTTFSGVLADNTGYGAGKLALWKTGEGTLTLSGASSFTGGIITSGNGVLYGMSSSAFGTGGSITLSSGTLRAGVTMNLDAARSVVITGAGGTLSVDASARLTVDGVISGGALLTKDGAGTLVLTAANTYTGGTHITAGLIEFGTLANLGIASLILDGGGLRWAAGNSVDVSARLSPLAAGSGFFDTQGNDVTLATALTGTGGLVKLGAGTLTLAIDPTYAGTTVVVAGKLLINGSPDGPISVGSGAEIEINGDATSSGLGGDGNMRLGSGTLTLNVAQGVFTSFNGVLLTTGGVIKNGLGTQAFAGPNTFAGGLTINGGVLQTNGDAGLGASTGFIHFNGGTLRWGLSFDIGSSREIILQAGGGAFDVSLYTTTITQGISGSGALTKLGTGILSLQGVNTFTGGIHLNNGILVGNASSLPGDISVQTGTILHLDQNTDAVWNASLSGGGAVDLVNQSGYGVLRMAAGNAYTNTGTTLVGANVYLVAGSANAFSAASSYTVNGTLDLSGFAQSVGSLTGTGTVYSYSTTGASGALTLGVNGSSTTFNGLIQDNTGSEGDSGKLALVKTGAGSFRPTAANTFSGGLTVNSGFVEFSSSANLGTGGITLNGGGLLWLPGNVTDISARLQPLGVNGGTLSLGMNSVSFATTPTGSGRLTLQSENLSGSLTFTSPLRHTGGTEILQTTLVLNLSMDSTYSGGFSGNGIINKSGAGTLTLGGTSTFSGQIGIFGGKIIATAASLPPSSVFLDGATMQIDQPTDGRVSGNLSSLGNGTFVKTGAGTLVLDGSNALFGTNYVLGGILEIGSVNAFSGRVTVDGAGIRWGTGITTSPLFDTFGTGGITLDTNGNDIVLQGDFYGLGSFVKNGAGRLTLPGRTSVAGSISVNGGTLAGGSVTFQTDAPITVASGAQLLLDQTGVPEHLLLISSVQGAGDLRITSTGAASAVLRLASTALLTYTGRTLVDANAALVLSSANALVTSSGVTLNGILDLGGFSQTISSLSGGGQIYSAGAGGGMVTLTVAQNSDTLFSGSLSNTLAGFQGVTALHKTGTGTLTLAGASTSSGGFTISSGRIDFSNAAALGSGTLTLDGGSLRWTGAGNATLANALILTSAGGTVDTGTSTLTFTPGSSGSGAVVKTGAGALSLGGLGHLGGTSLMQGTLLISGSTSSSYAGIISGDGGLAKAGTGTLTLTGVNTFIGGVTLNGGLLEFSAGSLGTTGSITFDGGGLKWSAGNTSDVSARFAPLAAGGATFDTGGNNVTLQTPLTGSSPVTKSGAGTLIVTDLLLHSSTVVITAGTLNARNDTDLTYTGSITGAGTFMKSGAGTLVLRSTHSVGATIIAGGLIEFFSTIPDTFGLAGSLTLDGGGLRWASGLIYDASPYIGPLGANGGVIDTNGNSFTFNAAISGSGPLIKQGAGTLTLASPDSSFTGGIIVRGGMIDLFRPESLGTGGITLDGGGIFLHDAFGLDLSTRLQPLGAGGGIFQTTSTQHTFSTLITGTGSLTKQGTGTLMLAGLAHTGGTLVLQGYLGFSAAASLGSGNITLNGGGLLWNAGSTIAQAAQLQLGDNGGTVDTGGGDVSFTTATVGSGSFTKAGTGMLKITGLGHAGGTLISGGSLEVQTNTDGTYAGIIIGGGLIKSGASTLTLTSSSLSLTSLTVNAGTLEFAGATALGSVTLNGGTLRWAAGNTLDISPWLNPAGTGGTLDVGSNNIIFAGNIGGGALIKQGSGTLFLRGGNTFSSLTVRQGLVDINGFSALGTGPAAGTVTLNGGGIRWQPSVAVDISSRLAPIGPDGAILDTSSNNILFATPLTGTGMLVKAGTGRLTLTEISHTGGTYIAEGTLEARVTTSTTTMLAGDGTFVKSGGGTLTLARGTFHTGVTTVSEGSLLVNGYHFGTITVQNHASLGGSGVLGYVTLQSGATLLPGISPGTLTLAPRGSGESIFDFQSGSTVQMQITFGGGPSDQLQIIGSSTGSSTLNFLGSLHITAIGSALPTQTETFQLLDWSGLVASPLFASYFSEHLIRDGSHDNGSEWDLPDISSTGLMWDLSQFTVNGTIQIVPEPGRPLLLLAGLFLACLRRTRK